VTPRKLARILPIFGLVAVVALVAWSAAPSGAYAQQDQAEPELVVAQSGANQPVAGQPMYSAWIVESCTFKDVPAGGFMPDRAYVPGSSKPSNNQVFFQLPVNIGIIKGGNDLVMYDTGWKQQQYIQLNDCINWAPVRSQMALIGLNPEDVTKVVIGHGHWDHAGQIDEFPNATLYVQQAELEGIEWALNYPNPKISETVCGRRPACGYPPEIVDQIYGKILKNQAVIVDGEMDIAPGLRIIPAHRAHTAGSQLLQVNTARGQFVFGSDVYSSWEGIRDWLAANIQQTDTVQQFLAYEKCYRITNNDISTCISAHEPTSYTSNYPITANAWVGPNGSRGAELVLAPGESSRKPAGAAAPAAQPQAQRTSPATAPAPAAAQPAAPQSVSSPAQMPRR
jgi:glyoxylase-like metal-dependent hydrolase (beta-lactamase superfamily II)